jgi:hypothetical protein
MPRNSQVTARHEAPKVGGSRPLLGAISLLLALGGLGVACSNGSAEQITAPVALGMTDKMTPYYSDGQLTLYQVQTPVQLPVRRPTDGDLQGLGAAPKGTMFPRAPFLKAGDESVEVRYVISNVDAAQHTVWLLIDPWNEFVRWKPGVTVVNDEVTVPNYGYDLAFIVPGKQRIEGTITPDDMQEIAIKLASVEKLLASPPTMQAGAYGATMDNSLGQTNLCNNIFNPQNRSNSGDLLYTPWIPPVIPGVTGFDLGLRTMDKANVAVEITIDVHDLNGNRFVQQDTTNPQLGVPPTVLSPPSARF